MADVCSWGGVSLFVQSVEEGVVVQTLNKGSVVVEGEWKHQEDKIVVGGWIVETAVIQNYF